MKEIEVMLEKMAALWSEQRADAEGRREKLDEEDGVFHIASDLFIARTTKSFDSDAVLSEVAKTCIRQAEVFNLVWNKRENKR